MNLPAPRATIAPDGLRADAARNRAQVLRVARGMLAEGDATLPMNVIARAAGVGVGTVYRHFPNRQVLLESLAAAGLARLLEQAQAAAAEPDPAAALRHLLRTSLRCLLGDIGLTAMLRSGQIVCTDTTELMAKLLAVSGDVLDRARAVGALRPEITPDDVRRYLLALETAASLTDSGSGPDLDQVDRDLEVFLAGLLPVRSRLSQRSE